MSETKKTCRECSVPKHDQHTRPEFQFAAATNSGEPSHSKNSEGNEPTARAPISANHQLQGQVDSVDGAIEVAGSPDTAARPASIPDEARKRQAFEALLVLVFTVLTTSGRIDPVASSEAMQRLTDILIRFIANILTRFGVPDAHQEARDIAQEVWVRFLKRDLARRFDQTRFELRAPFLWGVCRMVILEWLRKHRPFVTIPPDFDIASPELTPFEMVVVNEVRKDVQIALASIDPKRSNAIRERFWGGEHSDCVTDPTRYGRVFQGKKELKPLLRRHAAE
jgi:DNA-directed RNA polymerase specialized sigma24 family protein